MSTIFTIIHSYNQENRELGSGLHTPLWVGLSEPALCYPMAQLQPHRHKLGTGGAPTLPHEIQLTKFTQTILIGHSNGGTEFVIGGI